ncbi:hypothetical protein [Microbacterium aerolatum]|uniref:hypothetical protein n=1 Tax=Microbacterium aerolatum TaxID=153731 RepID=UPI00384B6339
MNRADRINAALEQFDRHMVEATGYTHDEYAYIRAAGPTSLEHVKLYGTLVDESGAVEFLERCQQEDRKSSAGRKPQLSFRAVLILLMMHVDGGDARYGTIARTLFAKTTPATREYLGLSPYLSSERQWYMRFHRSLNRILDLLEPWDVSKKHIITAEEFVQAKASYSQEKRDRAEDVVNMLLRTSIKRLPADIRARYKGNVAIDATPIFLVGEPNYRWGAEDSDRLNLNAMSTRYTRAGNHEGKGHEDDEPAWEMETVVTVANKPDDNLSFPVLMTGASFQHPGRNKYGPLRAMKQHCKLFDRDERHRLMADQEYNGFQPHRFQNEIRKLGFRGVFNHSGKRKPGKDATIGDAVLVDGYLFVKWMPRHLMTSTGDYAAGRIGKALHIAHIESRKQYALTPHGRPDEDGFQRFTYPKLTGLMLFDPATGARLKRTPKLTSQSLTVGPDSPEAMRVIKNLSAVQYYTEEWHAWFGLRNRAEENNLWFKSDAATDIGNPEKRRARGYAYNFLTAGMAAAVSNMRRIVSHLEAEASLVVDRPTLRARRRVDIDGKPLERLDAVAA